MTEIICDVLGPAGYSEGRGVFLILPPFLKPLYCTPYVACCNIRSSEGNLSTNTKLKLLTIFRDLPVFYPTSHTYLYHMNKVQSCMHRFSSKIIQLNKITLERYTIILVTQLQAFKYKMLADATTACTL